MPPVIWHLRHCIMSAMNLAATQQKVTFQLTAPLTPRWTLASPTAAIFSALDSMSAMAGLEREVTVQSGLRTISTSRQTGADQFAVTSIASPKPYSFNTS